MTEGLSREVEIDPRHAALLLIDVQNYTANRDGGVYRGLVPREIDKRYGYFFATLRESAIPNMQRLQKACRQGGIEILYTVIESLTRDGRDRGLDYKISGLHVPKGSPDAAVLAELAPAEDEIVIPKTSSSPFISTNIDYVLRNLGVRFLMIGGDYAPTGPPTTAPPTAPAAVPAVWTGVAQAPKVRDASATSATLSMLQTSRNSSRMP